MYEKKDSLDVISMFGMLGKGTTTQLACFVCAFFTQCVVDDVIVAQFAQWASGRTRDVLWEVIVWSLLALESGKHPHADYRGEPFVPLP